MTGQPGTGGPGPGRTGLAPAIIALLGERRQHIAVAESLTGGLLGAALTAVPGASAVFRGGVIAYATDLKAALLGVPTALLAAQGAVHPDVAAAMADGVRERLRASLGVATTGVAGPDPADGKPAGTVHIAVSSAAGRRGRALALTGDREQIRLQAVASALMLVWEVLREETR